MLPVIALRYASYIRDECPSVWEKLSTTEVRDAYVGLKVQGIEPLVEELIEQGLPAHEIISEALDNLVDSNELTIWALVERVLEEQYETQYLALLSNGFLMAEIISMAEYVKPILQELSGADHLNERELEWMTYSAVTGALSDYFGAQQFI